MGLHTLRMIGLRPRRCSSSHHSSTFAVGWVSLSLNTLIRESFLKAPCSLFVAGLLVMRPGNLGALSEPLQILPAPLLPPADRPAGPTLDPLAHLGRVPHPSAGRGLH